MKKTNTKTTPLITAIFLALLFTGCSVQRIKTKDVFSQAEEQTKVMLKEVIIAQEKANNPELVSPRTLSPSGDLELVKSGDWTSGFFPGTLWYLYEFTKDDKWLEEARKFTNLIEQEKMNGRTHDMGFKVYCSFGNGYRLTNDQHYKDVIIQAAQTLATRFNPKTGVILSWDHSRNKWVNPVIIDNMMNLELLFEATKLTGDSSFYNIAVSHANTTIKNHFRTDYSTYHVVDYNPETGEILKKTTHQGYSNESAWSRGEAWALYGYIMCYRETKDKTYLDQAEHIANYMFNHPNMPEDLVPYWDFDAPNIPNEPRDVSAAAVIASGLYELSTYNTVGGDYKTKADKIIESLNNKYRSPIGQNKGFILISSTGAKPTNTEVDVPLSYADYYYLEALLRKEKL
jgi:rhamnogalacturonyl hydrolase YesR